MSKSKEIVLFELLRKKVVSVFIAKYPAIPNNVQEWTGQNIIAFQEDLQDQVQTTISEKWFYTYFKQEALSKLPRVDMLNLLSAYVGSNNWQQFLIENYGREETKAHEPNKLGLKIVSGVVIIALIIYMVIPRKIEYNFCFVDKDVSLPITTPLYIQIIKEGESPVYLSSSEEGCFTFKSMDKSIKFIVESPYYKSETIIRNYHPNLATENVKLAADEYALILHYFSTNNVEDWNTRRTELGKMINDDAVIYQVFGNQEFGIDILSKEAFINKITLPTSSLRNMKIIEIERKNDQIVKLKFETKLDYE